METWYVMEDGSCGDPREIAEGADGVLRHTDGRSVAYRPDGVTPRSRGVNAEQERAKAAARGGGGSSKDMKPEGQRKPYRTRESKAN